MKKGLRYVILFIVVMTLGLQLFNYDRSGAHTQDVVRDKQDVALTTFLDFYHSGSFQKLVLVDDVDLEGYILQDTESKSIPFVSSGKDLSINYYTVLASSKPVSSSLQDLGISLSGSTILEIDTTKPSIRGKIFEFVGPILLFFVVLFVLFKFMMPKGGGLPFAIKIGKLSVKSQTTTKFKDIAGMDEVKAELAEIVDYLKNPDKYIKVGARHPKGVLLFGQPGSGKTLLAKAVAGEASVSFFSASGSEFMEMLVGMGAAKVRELFNKAKAAGKAIVFIDEIDAVGKKRGSGHTGGHQEQEQTLNQILTEMDGFDTTTNIVVIAATNRPDVLDPALLRAGRFDRKIYVARPTFEERILILKYYLQKKKVDQHVDIESLAKRTSGLVGADIENIVNEAALKVARDNRNTLSKKDFEYALEKVIMGPEKKIQSITEEEKNIIAYHELGHAVTAHILPHADPVEKISIVSRGQALGVTWMMPREDKYLYSKQKFLDDVVSLLGGRAAEEVFFGKDAITTGASNDFERATRIITDMVAKYGMDEDLGPVMYRDSEKDDILRTKAYSEQTAQYIDQRIKHYLLLCYKKALDIVTEYKNIIKAIALVLLQREYLSKEEFATLMQDPQQSKKMLEEAVAEEKELLAD